MFRLRFIFKLRSRFRFMFRLGFRFRLVKVFTISRG